MHVYDPEPELEPEPEPYSNKMSEPEPSSNIPVPQPCFEHVQTACNVFWIHIRNTHCRNGSRSDLSSWTIWIYLMNILKLLANATSVPTPVRYQSVKLSF